MHRSSDVEIVLACEEGDVDELLHDVLDLFLLSLEPFEALERDPSRIVLAYNYTGYTCGHHVLGPR